MAELFKVSKGYADGNIHYLSGGGAPGATDDTNAAPVGSYYSDVDAPADVYKKILAGSGTDKWQAVSGAGAPASDASLSVIDTVTAGGNITAGFGVVMVSGLAYRFDNTNPAHLGTVIGVAKQSFNTGLTGDVLLLGPITQGGWGLTPGNAFLSATGAVTNTPPASGIVQPIGVINTSTNVYVRVGVPLQQI